MRQKFEALRETLEEFASQDEYPMLVIGGEPVELAYVMTFFQGLNATHPEAYFLCFPQDFVTPALYMDAVVENVRTQVEGARELREAEGVEPFPPFPAELSDGRMAAEKRLFSLLMYLRNLIPNEDEHRVLVGLLPMKVHDWDGFHRLIASIVPLGSPSERAWMRALRIVAHDDRRSRRLLQWLRTQNATAVLTYELDFSTAALTAAIAEDAANPAVPALERMGALLQLAALDFSYKRYPEALEKYGVLYSYYGEHEHWAMQAVCLGGVGDVLTAQGNPRGALEKYQQALARCLAQNAKEPLLNLLLGATNVCFALQRFEDAAGYAENGTKVAGAMMNPYAYCDFFEKWGDALVAQRRTGEGLRQYMKAREQCILHNYVDRNVTVLERMKVLFGEARMAEPLAAVEQEMAALHSHSRAPAVAS